MDFPTGQRQSTNIKCYIYCNAFKLQCDIPHSPELKNKVFFLLFARTFSSFGITNKTVTKNPSEPRHSISGSDDLSGSDFSVVLILLYENLKFAPIFLKDLCHAAAILSQETEKALCLHG